ncbi:hypothetical protein ACFE04_002249 [Oxalis oulophora]
MLEPVTHVFGKYATLALLVTSLLLLPTCYGYVALVQLNDDNINNLIIDCVIGCTQAVVTCVTKCISTPITSCIQVCITAISNCITNCAHIDASRPPTPPAPVPPPDLALPTPTVQPSSFPGTGPFYE